MGADRQRQIEEGLLEKWTAWIERVYEETVALFAYRSFYRGLTEMTQASDAIPPSSFFDALGAWYATTQVMLSVGKLSFIRTPCRFRSCWRRWLRTPPR